MKRGLPQSCKARLYSNVGKPIRILGIASAKRTEHDCAREDAVSTYYLKLALNEAKKQGAEVQLIELKDLKIGPCKECYSTCPAQCRFNSKNFMCDCYAFKTDQVFIDNKTVVPIEKAYDMLDKKKFFEIYGDEGRFAERDDMWIIYKAMIEADAIIFAGATNYYGRPPLLQTMISRLTALDGGVELLWGDGKNLQNSIKYAKNPNAKYKQRLYGKWCAFINCSKEGDSISPNLMKACSMMGMKILPLGVAYRVNWYDDSTHRTDTDKSKKDKYSISLVKHLGKELVLQVKNSSRKYGLCSSVV